MKEFSSGFEGVSWKKVVPLNKVTLVQFDENSYVDDYAYIAAIPSAVFYDEKMDKIYSNPLLFYDKPRGESKEELSLNARQGLNYFMEDWMTYCGKLQKVEAINIGNERPWSAKNYTYINSQDIYEIAEKIALNDWSYSKDAVVAVVGEMDGKGNETFRTLKGSLSPQEIKKVQLSAVKQDSEAPQYSDFYVDEGYKYIKADLTWPSVSWFPTLSFIFTLGLLGGGLTVPSADPDLHLYCNYENDLMQVASSQNWNIMKGPWEHCETYVYAPGDWKTAVVDIPTKGIIGERHGSIWERIQDIVMRKVTYYIDVSIYPGKEVELNDIPPFMCRDVNFELDWSGGGKLGLVIVDENNVAVGEAVAENVSKQTLHLDQLGEGNYKAVIVQLGEANTTISYTLKYSWKSSMEGKSADYLMNAAEGSIIASLHNSPLLYTTPDSLHKSVKNVINKLGIKNIYFVNIGNHSTTVRDELERKCEIKEEYNDLVSMYKEIQGQTGENDIVFSTIDPWSYWLVEKLKPEGEKKGAFYIGPAAYAAAHHGAPLII
ncbi:hypothetical protein B6U81_02960 [Thermoplasmatales archaeon ex4484_30]|nr:MAG: hypothetical protein B6U81_02960 [Thermoplasmatales archaeon ex4484_30]